MTNLFKAVLAVMAEVKNIDKDKVVGSGSYAYKGVSDQSVKQKIGESMRNHGLLILPIEISPTVSVDRWDEGGKAKQNVFTEVRTKYLLCHESGESIELQGYGQGIDSQDKSAGKATTYALKYCLLYTFMVATGAIDDADDEHSEDKAIPKVNGKPHKAFTNNSDDNREWLNKGTKAYDNAVAKLQSGTITMDVVMQNYKVSKAMQEELNNLTHAKF